MKTYTCVPCAANSVRRVHALADGLPRYKCSNCEFTYTLGKKGHDDDTVSEAQVIRDTVRRMAHSSTSHAAVLSAVDRMCGVHIDLTHLLRRIAKAIGPFAESANQTPVKEKTEYQLAAERVAMELREWNEQS